MNKIKKVITFVLLFTITSILFLKFNVQAKTELPPADIGWANVNNSWYYYTSQNKKAVGWLNVNNNSYYLQNDGKMKIGWLNNDNTYYYLNESGAMAKSWTKINGEWYYFQSNGSMLSSSWVQDNGKWYYINDNGNMKSSAWLNYSGNWYYLQSDGSMLSSSWIQDNGKWYYINDSGNIKSSDWLNYCGNWYYFQKDGSMATNTTIDAWIIDSNGIGMKNNVIIDKDASEKKDTITTGNDDVEINDRTITNKGIKFIADYEGFSATAYVGQDVQNKTIGYGHVIQPDENFTSLTESQAEDLLKNDLTNSVNGVNSLTNQIDLNNNQFDSLVSFSYNCGLHAFAESQLLKDIKANASSKILKDDFCNYIHIIDKYGTSVKSLGLWRRRMDEWDLYTNGDYNRDYPNW